MMKTLEVEWLHLDQQGDTCDRCANTGKAIRKVICELQRECRPRGWNIIFKETMLSTEEISRSNLILINGRPLETLLPGALAGETHCSSCCDLLGDPLIKCRTVLLQGKTYEDIPPFLIREAVCSIARCC